jgi:hypothetical protein
VGPTCGFEAVENLIQLFRKVPNNLAYTDLIPRAAAYGFASQAEDGWSLSVQGCQRILADYDIPARWYPFDWQNVIIPALWNNRGILVVAEGHALNPGKYAAEGIGHAVLITNYCTDSSSLYLIGYVGGDSNSPGKEELWAHNNMVAATNWAAHHYRIGPALITDLPVTWAKKASYYKLVAPGIMNPVPW